MKFLFFITEHDDVKAELDQFLDFNADEQKEGKLKIYML